ncbi:L,D-transpeptidase family protein [Sphingomonas immobilis]|uniref:L,D-transpeptidase family protein n=1 Tax=Sphingomonas immobilis TaxID=3063997 RepID=A0ABT8ZXD4_9SPHN|nr:L,D-transpeptidase family protein [Sphingomonas sp. CA1-15]MDO7841804.1 L,D-transpeptidase family protein [Sphingomonas sp. CA1-15]
MHKFIVATALIVSAASAAASAGAPANVDQSVLQVQVVLDHLGFSPGLLDGKTGKSFTTALKGFQESRGLTTSGTLDDATRIALKPYATMPATRKLRLSAEVLAGPFISPIPKALDQQAKLSSLGYSSVMEKLAEMFHTTPEALRALNPPRTPLVAGTPVVFPNALPYSRAYGPKLNETWRKTLAGLNVDAKQPVAAKVVVDKSDQVLKVYDAGGKLVAQFQATMGSEHDPLPIGTWKIQGADYNPKFHYDPKLFWNAKKSDDPATLPAGPNGPVGVVWIDLSKPHYGIHGTPEPATIGRAESHGCIRLTNWDAARLSLMVKAGTPAVFQL